MTDWMDTRRACLACKARSTSRWRKRASKATASVCHLSSVIAGELQASRGLSFLFLRTSFRRISRPMSYVTLKVFHLIGLALTFMGLAGALAANAVPSASPATRRIFVISHGVGLVVLLISGFLLLVQLGIGKNLPGWVWGKVIIWLLAGASLTLVRRFCRFQAPLLLYLAVLVGLAAWLALYKPF